MMISPTARNRSQHTYFLTVSLAATNVDPSAVGVAKFENNIGYRRFKLIITNAFSGGDYQVKVKGRSVGTIWVDNHGCGEFSLDTREGDAIPLLKQTDMVEVFNPLKYLILIGSFDLVEKVL